MRAPARGRGKDEGEQIFAYLYMIMLCMVILDKLVLRMIVLYLVLTLIIRQALGLSRSQVFTPMTRLS